MQQYPGSTVPGRKRRSECGHGRLSHPPDAFAVITNRTVGGELAHAGCVENGLPRPCLLVAPERTHLSLGVDVGRVVGKYEEVIVVEQILYDRAEEPGVAMGQRAAGDEIEHA